MVSPAGSYQWITEMNDWSIQALRTLAPGSWLSHTSRITCFNALGSVVREMNLHESCLKKKALMQHCCEKQEPALAVPPCRAHVKAGRLMDWASSQQNIILLSWARKVQCLTLWRLRGRGSSSPNPLSEGRVFLCSCHRTAWVAHSHKIYLLCLRFAVKSWALILHVLACCKHR